MVIIVTKEVDNYIYLCEKIKNKDFQKRVKTSFEYCSKIRKNYQNMDWFGKIFYYLLSVVL